MSQLFVDEISEHTSGAGILIPDAATFNGNIIVNGQTSFNNIVGIYNDSSVPVGGYLWFVGADNVGAASPNMIMFRRSRGTNAVPIVVNVGDEIGKIKWQGYSSAGYSGGLSGQRITVIAESVSPGPTVAGRFEFYTVMVSGTGETQVFQLNTTGVGGETPMMVYDITATTLRRVSIGVADSGGVGFRVLRIPN